MTSSIDFEEEPNVPPVVVYSADFPAGGIFGVTAMEFPLEITVRDENLDDELELRARVSSLGSEGSLICSEPNGEPIKFFALKAPVRDTRILTLRAPEHYRPGRCTKVDVVVSRSFALEECRSGPTTDASGNTIPYDIVRESGDIGRATYWIWDLTGDPLSNPAAAQALFTSCPQPIPVTQQPRPSTSNVVP